MSKPGNYTAYQQYKPLDNGTIQAIQHWSGFAEQKRQNDIAQAQKDKQLESQADKDKQDELDKWLSYDSIPMTGVENVDIAHAKIAATDRSDLQKLVGELTKTDKNSERGIELRMKIDKIQKNPAVIKGMISAPLKLAQEYFSNPDKYVRNPDNDNFFENLKNAEYTRNSNGDPAFIVKDPKDPKNTKVLTEAQILNLQEIVPLVEKLDWNKTIIEQATALNKTSDEKKLLDQKNNVITTVSGYNPEQIKSVAESLFMDQQGNLTTMAKSFLMQKGLYSAVKNKDENSYNELLKLQDQFVKDITPFIKDKYAQEFDKDGATFEFNKSLGWANYNNRERALDIASAKAGLTPKAPVNFKKVPTVNGDRYEKFAIEENSVEVVSGPKEEKREILTNVSIDPNVPNKIIMNVIQRQDDGTKKGVKETSITYNSRTQRKQVAKIAAEMGMTIEQLYKKLAKEAGTNTKNKIYGGLDAEGNVIWK